MNTQTKTTLNRLLMAITLMIMLLGLTGGMPVSAAERQASYIVQAANTELAAQLVQAHGGEITSRLSIIHAVAANLTDNELTQLRLETGVLSITPNGEVSSSDDGAPADKNKKDNDKGIPSSDYPELVGADLVWDKHVTGKGVAVAILDTGIAKLPQLNQNTKNKSGRIVGWKDFIQNSKTAIDPNGHGSHVAGIIANSQKGNDGYWNGIAPDANLVGVRVLDKTGAGTYESVINGLQWVLENKERYNIKIINLSLVSNVQSPYWADPLNQAVTAAWADGLTVIVAAGNSGPEPMSISVPGNNPYVITVGAFTDKYTPTDWSDDYIADFSSAGPTLDGFVKPDLVAPGAHMVSIAPEKSYLTSEYPENRLKANYFKLAGTSQATATVSGVAALMLSQNPNLTPDQVKYRLTVTALPWVDESNNPALYSMFQQGAGRANAFDAVFSNETESANAEMDIAGDLAGSIHYEGYAYYDEATQTYRLREPFTDWNDSFSAWDGNYNAWSGRAGTWSGDYGAWSGRAGTWSGRAGTWSGRAGTWSGRAGTWSGRAGTWSGGYTTWSGRAGTWSGRAGTWSGRAGTWSGKAGTWSGSDPTFIANFASGVAPSSTASTATISNFLLEP